MHLKLLCACQLFLKEILNSISAIMRSNASRLLKTYKPGHQHRFQETTFQEKLRHRAGCWFPKTASNIGSNPYNTYSVVSNNA